MCGFDYSVELRGGQEPVRYEVDYFSGEPVCVRVRANSMGPEFTSDRSDHIHEGRGLFVPVPRGLGADSLNVFLVVSVMEVPENGDCVGGEHHSEGVDDSGMPLGGVRVGTRFLGGCGVFGISAPPPILGIFEAHELLGVSEGDLDFPSAGEEHQDLFDGAVGIGAEVGAVIDSSFGVTGQDHPGELCAGHGIPETTLGFDEDRRGFSVDVHVAFRPWSSGGICQFCRRRQTVSFKPFSASPRGLYGQVIQGSIHGHGAYEGEGQLRMAQYGSAGIFGVCDDGKGSVRG